MVLGGFGLVTVFSQEWLTLTGNAIVTVLSIVAGAFAGRAISTADDRLLAASVVGACLVGIVVSAAVFAGPVSIVGGCQPFKIYAQNRWNPLGTAIREAPYPDAKQIGGFAPNQILFVNGWVRTRTGVETNTPPWNSDQWFHLADDTGWVSFAGVRADPTPFDPTGLDPDGGRPVPTAPECSAIAAF